MPQTGLWHFRVHYEPYSTIDIVDFIKDKASVIIAVRETASRPHIHCVISSFNQTKSTFVQQFLKQFPELNGNGSYSCSKKDDMEAQIRYCSKGESKETMPEVLYCQNDIDWQDYHNKYWEENSLLKAKSNKDGNMGLQKDTSLVVKAKSKTWTEKVFDEIKNLYSVEILTIQTFQLLYKPTDKEIQIEMESRKIIFRYFMKCMGKGVKKLSKRILEDMFDGIINALIQLNDDAGEKYADRMFNSIYNWNGYIN